MKRFIALLIMATMVLSTAGAASAVTTVYQVVGTTNPDAMGNVMDLASSGVANTAIGATYPKATVYSGTEAIVTDNVKNTAGTWIILFGGPVANSITKELVDAGKLSATMDGYKKVINAWGTSTANVMAIYGPDRTATQAACQKYAADLRAGVEAAQLTGVGVLSRTFKIQEFASDAMATGTQVWREDEPDTSGNYDVEGSVVSTDSEVAVETEGDAKSTGAKINLDLEQKSGESQDIAYKGDLTVGDNLSLTGTLTGTFSGQTGFGTMQDGIVTLEADDMPGQVDIYVRNLVVDVTGIPEIEFDDFALTQVGSITPPLTDADPSTIGITELSGEWAGQDFANDDANDVTALAMLEGPNQLEMVFLSGDLTGTFDEIRVWDTISIQPRATQISAQVWDGTAYVNIDASVSFVAQFILHTKISPATELVNEWVPPFTLSNGAFFTGTITGDIAA